MMSNGSALGLSTLAESGDLTPSMRDDSKQSIQTAYSMLADGMEPPFTMRPPPESQHHRESEPGIIVRVDLVGEMAAAMLGEVWPRSMSTLDVTNNEDSAVPQRSHAGTDIHNPGPSISP